MSQTSKSVPIKDIVIDRNLNPRVELDKDTIDQYQQQFDELPPVVVFETERGLLLADGFHRYHAGKALAKSTLECEVRSGTYRDAMEYAALANLHHGKPLTTKERGNVAETILVLHSNWADNRIAKLVGLHHTTVGKVRARLESEGKVAKLATSRVGSDGVAQPLAKARPDTQSDIWTGKVLDGDALSILPALDNSSCDLIFVDPPYGILNKQEWDRFASIRELVKFTRHWLDLVVPKLKPTGRLYVCYSQWYVHLLRRVMTRYERDHGLEYSNTIIWFYKNAMTKANDRHEYKMAHDPILYYRAKEAPELDFSKYGEEQGDVWEIATPQSNFNEGKEHPAQKPLELLRRVIATGCPAGGLVLDPFAGSGTTAVAAYELGRAFKVIEQDPGYVAVIRRRLDTVAKTGGASHQMAPGIV